MPFLALNKRHKRTKTHFLDNKTEKLRNAGADIGKGNIDEKYENCAHFVPIVHFF